MERADAEYHEHVSCACLILGASNRVDRGPLSKITSKIPGMAGLMEGLAGEGTDEEASTRLKRLICITDSMSPAELDSDGMIFMKVGKDGKPVGLTQRVRRVAKGSGASIREVEEVLMQHRMMANVAKQMGGKNGMSVTICSYRRGF